MHRIFKQLGAACWQLWLLLGLVAVARAAEPEVVDLWPGLAPDRPGGEHVRDRGTPEKPDRSLSNVTAPTLTAVLPATPTGAAVIICPGGGYTGLAYDKEGLDVARWLATKGIAGLVLKYRLPRGAPGVSEPVPLQDLRAAMRIAKAKAAAWQIDPARIGVMGFSAGGHLASTLATHATAADRPAFAVLVYPVISFTTPATHTGSRASLLGNDPSPALVERYSSELQVTAETPPCFLVHAADDPVKVANSELFAAALKAKEVPHEFLRLQTGGHGFGLGVRGGEPAAWPARFLAWMQERKILTP